jgi:hypothetical protein
VFRAASFRPLRQPHETEFDGRIQERSLPYWADPRANASG